MVECIGNEVVVNAESEHSHKMNESNVCNDVIMAESVVHSKEGELVANDANNTTVACSEVDQNMNAESVDKHLSLADDGEQDGKASMDEIANGIDQKLSECNNMTDVVHEQEVSPVLTGDIGSISADEKTADTHIAERNGESQASLHSEATNLPSINEGSVMMDPATGICITGNTVIQDKPMVDSSGNFESGQQQILENTETENFGEQMQSNLVKLQENTGKNTETVGEPCEQTKLTASGHLLETNWVGHQAIEVQEYSDDTEIVDSGEANEEPEKLAPENSLSQSEDEYDDDDDQIDSVSDLKGNASDNENEAIIHLKMSRKKAKRKTKENRATYDLPAETEDKFSVNNLVWGKVKSHPWWPGQIFDQSDSSEKAMKYRKKDSYLVAYFGDKSFAWNDASQLKHFRAHFSQEEKQSNSEAFRNAIECALEEVSRRAELGLTCSCIPKETREKIRFQIVENAGVKTDSSKRESSDGYITPESFQPDKLFDYVKTLAQLPTSGINQLELTIAKSQLLSFYRLKGVSSLPEFQFFVGSLEEKDVDTVAPPADVTVKSKGPKRKHNLKDIVYHRRKEKSFSEIMGESLFYYDEDYDSDEKLDGMLNTPTVGRKRKASNFLDDQPSVPETTKTISVAKVSKTATPSPRQSFKIGDCIRRVAIQLTGSSSTPNKPTDDENKQHVEPEPEETGNEVLVTSPDDYILQLYVTAQDPLKGYGYTKSVVNFFSEFRDAVVSVHRKSLSKDKPSSTKGSGRKRKASLSLGVAPEEFEYHDKKDSYWADMVVEDNPEEKVEKPARRKKKERQPGTEESEKPRKTIKKRQPKKEKVNGNHGLSAEQICGDEGKYELPTELVMIFGDISSVPSVADLNRIFRRFGPLKLSETEADKENSRARVVFKNGSDAQIALSSAATFNIFGSGTVSYELIQETPSVSSHGSTLPTGDAA